MKHLSRIFLTGLAAVVPLALTVALLVWLGLQSEKLFGGAVAVLVPDAWVFPGLGLLLGIALVFGVGLLMQVWLVRRLFAFGEAVLERIPLIKTVYGSIKDVMQMFSRRSDEEAGRPVIVRLPGRDEALLGFVTRDSLGEDLGGEDTVAVYLPMSYQIGGYTLLLPRDRVETLDMGAQQAMRFILTAGMGLGKSQNGEESTSSPGKSQNGEESRSIPGKSQNGEESRSTPGMSENEGEVKERDTRQPSRRPDEAEGDANR